MNGIMMLVNEFPPLPVGGAERQAERLATWLAGRGWRVSVLTRGTAELALNSQNDGIHVLRITSTGFGKVPMLKFVTGALWNLLKRRAEYQILHAHLAFGPAFAAVVAARLLGKRAIVKFGNSGEFGDIVTSQRTVRGRIRLGVIRRWADVVIVLDDNMQREAISAGFDPQRIRRMNNGIDSQTYFTNHSRAAGKASLGLIGKVVALYVGRLTEQKSLPTLINAFAIAVRSSPTLHLLILGDGVIRTTLEELTVKLKISDRVTFTGTQADVRPYLEAADIFVLPSLSEGISNALLEAMSAGLACVTTPVGGNADLLDKGSCGILLPAGDVSAWTTTLIALGNDSARREELGAAAQKRVQQYYDFSQVGVQYEELYNTLIGEMVQ